MFWLTNKKNNFQLRTLIWRPALTLNPFMPNVGISHLYQLNEFISNLLRNISKEAVVLARLRLGHTRVIDLLLGEEQPQCVGGDFAQVK